MDLQQTEYSILYYIKSMTRSVTFSFPIAKCNALEMTEYAWNNKSNESKGSVNIQLFCEFDEYTVCILIGFELVNGSFVFYPLYLKYPFDKRVGRSRIE